VRRGRDEAGFTLIELLVAMTLMLIVMGATLTVVDSMVHTNQDLNQQNDAQDAARTAIDAIATDLRNVAEPNPPLGNPAVPPPAVEQATDWNLVVREVDPAGPATSQNTFRVRRVRYCLTADTTGHGQLYKQVQTWTTPDTPTMPSTTSCPGPSWPKTQLIASSLTNRLKGPTDGKLFQYTPANFTDPTTIQSVIPTFYVDTKPRTPDREAKIASALYMRNQNRPPVSDAAGQAFSVTVSGSGGVSLNALGFSDPDGGSLTYVWYDGTTKIGSGPYLQWVVSKQQRNANHTFSLKVFDDKGAETDAPGQTVFVT
jgi:prepilin-type N-terminal cleavage/methylation domain-containing protein